MFFLYEGFPLLDALCVENIGNLEIARFYPSPLVFYQSQQQRQQEQQQIQEQQYTAVNRHIYVFHLDF